MPPCAAVKLHSLANASPTMMAAWDPALRCRFANSAYRTWFGVNPAELPGTPIQDLLGPRLFALNEPFMEGALRGQPQEFERTIPGPSNTVRHSLARYTPDWDRGVVDGFLVEVVDITACKSIESALLERVADLQQETHYLRYLLQRRSGEDGGQDTLPSARAAALSASATLTAQIAHELRNAISPVATSLATLQAVDANDDRARRASTAMHRQLALATRLLNDLIDLSGIEAGVLSMRKRKVDLREVIEEALDMSLPGVRGACHDLHVDLPQEALPLMCDPQRLAQALCNLLDNACKYSPAASQITLGASRQDGQLQITVSASGIGMPPESTHRLFELFAQLPHSAGSRNGGRGIGLSIVHKIVALHGGVVRASSAGLGEGSTFTIMLPCTSAH